jgi:hypothetical protein
LYPERACPTGGVGVTELRAPVAFGPRIDLIERATCQRATRFALKEKAAIARDARYDIEEVAGKPRGALRI